MSTGKDLSPLHQLRRGGVGRTQAFDRVGPVVDRLRRLFLVVVRGKVMVMLVTELFLVFTLLIVTLISGAEPSELLKSCLIFPAMLLIGLCGADTVAILRSSGDLELMVTLASPARSISARLWPVWLLAVVQVLAVAVVLATFMPVWQVLLGLLQTPLALVFAAVSTLYSSLRTRGPGSAMLLALALLIVGMIWIGNAELLRESAETTLLEMLLSALRCQAGLLLASLSLAALARRRLEQGDQLLESA